MGVASNSASVIVGSRNSALSRVHAKKPKVSALDAYVTEQISVAQQL